MGKETVIFDKYDTVLKKPVTMIILAPKPQVAYVKVPVMVHPLPNPNMMIIKRDGAYKQVGWNMYGQPIYKRV